MAKWNGCDRSQVLISPAREDVPPRRGDAWQFWCNRDPPPSSHFPVSNGHPVALGAALVTGGKLSPHSNYLDDHILFTSASNASPSQNRRVPWAVFTWKCLRIAAPQSAGALLLTRIYQFSHLMAKVWRLKAFVASNIPFSLYPAASLIKAQRLFNGWFNGKIQLARTSGCVMRVCFPTNDLGPFAFIGLLCLASCGISCRTRRVI